MVSQKAVELLEVPYRGYIPALREELFIQGLTVTPLCAPVKTDALIWGNIEESSQPDCTWLAVHPATWSSESILNHGGSKVKPSCRSFSEQFQSNWQTNDNPIYVGWVVLDEQKGARMIIFRHLNDELKLESEESVIFQLLVPVRNEALIADYLPIGKITNHLLAN